MARILRAVADVAVPTRRLEAWIFDVDGVLLASPHERAWREALHGSADPARLTTAMYQACVAGRSRLDGALAALTALGVTDVGRVGPALVRHVRRPLSVGWPIRIPLPPSTYLVAA